MAERTPNKPVTNLTLDLFGPRAPSQPTARLRVTAPADRDAPPPPDDADRLDAPPRFDLDPRPVRRAPRTDPQPQEPLTVSQVNRAIRQNLTSTFPLLRVRGEIGQLKAWNNTLWFFDLKDANATIGCRATFDVTRGLPFQLETGLAVVIEASADLYEKRGQLQLTVRRIEPEGRGALEVALRQLIEKLESEGLFDPRKKRPLPRFPRVVGVVTSPEGAAVRDFLTVLRRRMPGQRILIAPSRVQGDGAARDLLTALNRLAAIDDVDVIVLTRGGGSLEDLWAFNDEALARAIAACPKPVVSAVGHEVDTSLSDLVADLRAPTPTAAASLVVQDRDDLDETLEAMQFAMARALRHALAEHRHSVAEAATRLSDPRITTRRLELSVRNLDDRRRDALARHLLRLERRLSTAFERLQRQSPEARLAAQRARLAAAQKRLTVAIDRQLRLTRDRHTRAAENLPRLATRTVERRNRTFTNTIARLDALSPLRVMARGYSLAFAATAQQSDDATSLLAAPLIRGASEVAPGDSIALLFSDLSTAHARVESCNTKSTALALSLTDEHRPATRDKP